MTKTPTPASHAVNTAPISADLRGMAQPQIGCHAVNESAWAFVKQMPHQLPGPVFNDLKPAVHAAICEYLRQTAKNAPESPAQQDAPAGQPSRECLQQSAEPAAAWPQDIDVSEAYREAFSLNPDNAAANLSALAEALRCRHRAALQDAPPAHAQDAPVQNMEDEQCRSEPSDWSPPSGYDGDGSVAAMARAAPPAPAGVAVPEGVNVDAWRKGARFALEAVSKVDSICWLTDSMKEICIKQAAEAVIAERDRMAVSSLANGSE